MSELEHYREEILAVEERIGRLAIVCRVDLEDEHQVHALRNGVVNGFSGHDAHTMTLLRQLLNLRDIIEGHLLAERGPEESRAIMEEIEVQLRQHGFRR